MLEAGGDAFFAGGLPYELCYRAGFLLGAWLDRGLRTAGQELGLDGCMRRFLSDETPTPNLAAFLELVREVGGASRADRLGTWLQGSIDAEMLVADLRATGIPIERSLAPPRLDLRANFDGTRVLDIDPDGLGYRVGLRSGDELFEVNGQFVESQGELRRAWASPEAGVLSVVLGRDGEERWLEWPLQPEASYRVDAQGWMAGE